MKIKPFYQIHKPIGETRLKYKLLHLFWYHVQYFIMRFNVVSKMTVWGATPSSLALYEPRCWFQVDYAGNRILRNVGTYQSRWSYSIIHLYSTYFRMRAIHLFFRDSFYTNSCHRTYCELEHQMINNYWCVVAAIMTFCMQHTKRGQDAHCLQSTYVIIYLTGSPPAM
jgi:hypothetical protein